MEIKNEYLRDLYRRMERRDPNEPEFLQAVGEVLQSLSPVADRRPDLIDWGVFERIVEPERMITFRVSVGGRSGQGAGQPRLPGAVQLAPSAPTRAACGCIPRSTPSIIKFLGFEQIFKNTPDRPAHRRRQGRQRL